MKKVNKPLKKTNCRQENTLKKSNNVKKNLKHEKKKVLRSPISPR